MICGALQTLNEDAFEDVAVSERPSPTGELSIQQYSLAPISEELGSPAHSRSVEDFLNNTANYIMQSNNGDELSQSSNSTMLSQNSNSTMSSQNSNSTVIVIHPSGSVDDTRL